MIPAGDAVMVPDRRGDQDGRPRWTSRTPHRLADALTTQGRKLSRSVGGSALSQSYGLEGPATALVPRMNADCGRLPSSP